MKNIEKYGNNIMNEYDGSIACGVRRLKGHNECAGIKCIDCNMDALKWLIAECKEPVLDDVEREYLSAVIKPFKNRVISITKVKDAYETKRFLRIVINGNDGREKICLPWFKGNTKYKGMKDFKGYTLKELGL